MILIMTNMSPRNYIYVELICNNKYVYKGNVIQTNNVFIKKRNVNH